MHVQNVVAVLRAPGPTRIKLYQHILQEHKEMTEGPLNKEFWFRFVIGSSTYCRIRITRKITTSVQSDSLQ